MHRYYHPWVHVQVSVRALSYEEVSFLNGLRTNLLPPVKFCPGKSCKFAVSRECKDSDVIQTCTHVAKVIYHSPRDQHYQGNIEAFEHIEAQ